MEVTLKSLQTQLAQARERRDRLKVEMAQAQRLHGHQIGVVAALESQIATFKASAPEPIVSEHAVLRWLERVEGLDVEAVRARILSGQTAAYVRFARTGRIEKDGHMLVVKDNVIVTVE